MGTREKGKEREGRGGERSKDYLPGSAAAKLLSTLRSSVK